MEANRADWNKLFEPYPFFEAYKHYLEIDITAANEDDLRKWKGWVESRLRTLTLKIERHTYGMLQCHPHPGDFSDKSRPFHCCYFMGLQRKQGVQVNEGEQFDIRGTVDDFKKSVGMYTLRKPGMEIQVSHIKRRNVPSFVFPRGIRPSRPLKAAGSEPHTLSKTKSSSLVQAGKPSDTLSESCDAATHLADDSSTRKQLAAGTPVGDQVVEGSERSSPITMTSSSASSLCTKEAEGSAINPVGNANGILNVTIESRKRKHAEDTDSNSIDARRLASHSAKPLESVGMAASAGPGNCTASLCSKEAEGSAINLVGNGDGILNVTIESRQRKRAEDTDSNLTDAKGLAAHSAKPPESVCMAASGIIAAAGPGNCTASLCSKEAEGSSINLTIESRKRKHVEDTDSNSIDAKRLAAHSAKLPDSVVMAASGIIAAAGPGNCTASLCSNEAEALAIKKITSGSPTNLASSPEGLDELQLFESQGQDTDFGGGANGCSVVSSVAKDSPMQVGKLNDSSKNGGIEELEPAELSAPTFGGPTASTSNTRRKPLIRLRLSSVVKETDKSA